MRNFCQGDGREAYLACVSEATPENALRGNLDIDIGVYHNRVLPS